MGHPYNGYLYKEILFQQEKVMKHADELSLETSIPHTGQSNGSYTN